MALLDTSIGVRILMASLSQTLCLIFYFYRITLSFIRPDKSLPIELGFMFVYSHEVTVELLIRGKMVTWAHFVHLPRKGVFHQKLLQIPS